MGLGLVELIVIGGIIAILGIGAMTAMGVFLSARGESRARGDLAATIDSGALPPSLHPKVDLGKCMGSGNCVTVCPENDVLAVLDGKAHVVNPTSCIGHGECLRACPVDAISLVLGSATRGVEIPLVDKHFQTNIAGIYVIGELGGMGLIYNAMTQALQCMEQLVTTLPAPVAGVHQIVIVGAGPAGMAASLAAKQASLDFVTVDQESMGGTVLQYPRHKLVMTKPVELPLYGRLRLGEVRKEALLDLWHDIVQKTGLEIRSQTRVESVTRDESGYFVVTLPEGETLTTQRVVLAMGRRGTPRKLGVPGEDLGKVVYRLLEPERYAGSRVLVVGGGDSALEAAVALADQGAQTTLSYRKSDFSRAKKKNRAAIDERISSGKVSFLATSTVCSIAEETVVLKVGDGEQALPNDYVLVFAGGVLPTAFLAAAGVEVESYTGQAYAPANE